MLTLDLTVKSSTDAIIVGAAVVAAGGVIWRSVVRPVMRFAQRVEKVMHSVETQLYPNEGSSLRDAVSKIQVALGQIPHLPTGNPPHERQEHNP